MVEKKIAAKGEKKVVAKAQNKEVESKDGNASAKENLASVAPDNSQSAIESPDATELIARRAYELYEQRGRQEGMASQDWGQAEREILKDKPVDKQF